MKHWACLWKRTVEYVAHNEKDEPLLFCMDSDADSNFDYARWEKVVVNPDGSYVVYNDADYYYEFYSLNHELQRKVKKEYVKGLCRAMSMLNLHHTGFSSNSRAMNGCRCQTSALQNSKLHKIFSE